MQRCARMPRGTRRYSNGDRQLKNDKPFETPPMPWPPFGKSGNQLNVLPQLRFKARRGSRELKTLDLSPVVSPENPQPRLQALYGSTSLWE